MQAASTEILARRAAPGLFFRPTATAAAAAGANHALVTSTSLETGLILSEPQVTIADLVHNNAVVSADPRSPIGSGGSSLQRQRSISLDEGLAGFMGGAVQTGRLWSRSLADGLSHQDSGSSTHELPPDPLFPDEDDFGLGTAVVSDEDEILTCMRKGALVPDRTMVRILDRKMETLSRKPSPSEMPAGWILDGFPRTANQVEALAEMRRLPDVVIHIDADEEDILTRILDRRTDPVTGETYNLKTNVPPEDVLCRLVKRSDDNLETVAQRLKTWKANWPAIEAAFAQHGVTVVSVPALPSESIDQVYQKVRKVMFDAARADGVATGTRPLNYVFTGAPGSGKGTQCELASSDFGINHLSTGQLLRDITASSPRNGKTTRKPPKLPTRLFTPATPRATGAQLQAYAHAH